MPTAITEELPWEIKEAVQRFGFHALAARVYGVDQLDERTAAQIVGTKLACRLQERRLIATGLRSLAALHG